MKKRKEYMVLGLKDMPVDPNNYGLICEKDNPLITNNYEFAGELVFKHDKKWADGGSPEIKARIVELKSIKYFY